MPLSKSAEKQKTMSEWERFKRLPETTMAEFIDGKIYMMASPSFRHQKILVELVTQINAHIKKNSGPCQVIPAPFSVRLDKKKKDYVEPDISVICDKSKITEEGCIGAPDMIIEIVSPSDPKHDYLDKLQLYNASGVREYWIVDPMEELVMVYLMEEKNFRVYSYTFKDKIASDIMKGMTIDFGEISALL